MPRASLISCARLAFSQLPSTAIIRSCCKSGKPRLSFLHFITLLAHHKPAIDAKTLVFVLKACGQFPAPANGEQAQNVIFKMGFDSDLVVRNALMHFYLQHEHLSSARKVFEESPLRDVVSWTTMIGGYVKGGMADEALRLFFLMLFENVEPNEITMVTVLSACSRIGVLSVGRAVHRYIESSGLHCGLNLVNALVDMYGKCGYVEIAREIFDGMEDKDVFSWTSMINGYAKCGALGVARELFEQMPPRNVVSWSTMIAGYAQANQTGDALEMFRRMVLDGVEPISATLVSVLSACAQSGCLNLGKWIHDHYIIQNRVHLSMKLANALMDMYAKCGCVDDAQRFFVGMSRRDLVSWNTMILGYATHGHTVEVLSLFEQMKSTGFAPDGITFVGVLSACVHGGLVAEGRKYFKEMKRSCRLIPKVEHYACMIDLLGRAGLLVDANNLIKSMPMEPDKAGWGALLNACRMHGHVELGRIAGEKILSLDPGDSGTYGLLSNMYANANKWDEVISVRRLMKECGIKKNPGRSSIEVDGKLHEFFAADISHLLCKEIYEVLDGLYLQLKWEGYVPIT